MMVLEVRSLVGDVRGDLFFLMWRGDRFWGGYGSAIVFWGCEGRSFFFDVEGRSLLESAEVRSLFG